MRMVRRLCVSHSSSGGVVGLIQELTVEVKGRKLQHSVFQMPDSRFLVSQYSVWRGAISTICRHVRLIVYTAIESITCVEKSSVSLFAHNQHRSVKLTESKSQTFATETAVSWTHRKKGMVLVRASEVMHYLSATYFITLLKQDIKHGRALDYSWSLAPKL